MSLRKGVLLIAAAALVVAFALPAFASGSGEKQAAQGGKIFIPMVSKGFQFQFWQTVMKGAQAAAAKYGVDMTFEGPPTESDIQVQVQELTNAMAKNPQAICLAALDTNSVMDQLNQAVAKKIPIIGFDSGVPNAPKGAIYATAATNSYAAAGLAADHMFPAIKDKIAAATADNPVTIVDANQDATSQSVTDRGKGFRDEMIKLITTQTSHTKDDIKVTGNPAYIAPDSPTSGSAIIIECDVPATTKPTDEANMFNAIMNRVQSDHILGIFCSNEGTVGGVLAHHQRRRCAAHPISGPYRHRIRCWQGAEDCHQEQVFLRCDHAGPVQYRLQVARACLHGGEGTAGRQRGHRCQVLRLHQHGQPGHRAGALRLNLSS